MGAALATLATLGAPASDEATLRLVDQLERQNALLRTQNARYAQQQQRRERERAEAGPSDDDAAGSSAEAAAGPSAELQLERRGADVEDNKLKWNALDKAAIAQNGENMNRLWLMTKTKTHLPEWGEDHANVWPDGAQEQQQRPVSAELIPTKVEPGELLDRTWMVLSGRIQDGVRRDQEAYDDYVGHYCPSIFAPPIFEHAGGSLCRACLTVVNELLEYLGFEAGGAAVPEAMRTDNDQMQTAFIKVCSLIGDVDPALVLDCKNFVEYWGTEIWCHVASGVYIDEGDNAVVDAEGKGQRFASGCMPGEPCAVDKPLGKERNAWRICQHLKMRASGKFVDASKKHCVSTEEEGRDRLWLTWVKKGQLPLCCPSMLYGADQKKPEKRDATRSVALYAKHYQNSDMIDLRYSWHQKDEADRTALGLTDALPATEGFSERLFNVGHEW